jgi:hypothetical protein
VKGASNECPDNGAQRACRGPLKRGNKSRHGSK